MKRLLFVLLVTAGVSSPGCNFGELKKAATEPNPDTGKTPTQQLVGGVPNVIENPLNPNAWSDIIEALVVLGAAGFGYKEWRQFRRNRTPTNTSGTTLPPQS